MKIAEIVKVPESIDEMKKHRKLSFLWNREIGSKIRINDEDYKAAKAAGYVELVLKKKSVAAPAGA